MKLKLAIEDFEKQYIIGTINHLIKCNDFTIVKLAATLGVSRRTMYYKIAKYDIKTP